MLSAISDGVDPASVPYRELFSGARMPGIGPGAFGSDHAQPDVYGMDLKRWQVTQFQQVGSGALLMEPFWSQPNTAALNHSAVPKTTALI